MTRTPDQSPGAPAAPTPAAPTPSAPTLAAPTPGGRARWHRATASIVFAWLTAAAFAVTFHRFLPVPTWLMAHLTLLGAVGNALLIWTHHFARAIARSRERAGGREEVARLAIFNVSVLTVTAGMVGGSSLLTLTGAAGVAAAAVWHAVALARLLRVSLPGRLRAPAHFYVAAALFLVPGALAGWWLSASGASAAVQSAAQSAHTAINLLGWVGLPILGTLITLWPTVLRVRMAESTEARARRALPLLTTAIVVVALGSLLPLAPWPGGGQAPALGPRLMVAFGVLAYVCAAAWLLLPAARVTVREKLDFAALSLGSGVIWLFGTLTFAAGWIAISGRSFSEVVSPLVIPLVGGGIFQVLLGALAYLLPVMAGGGPSVLRGRIARVDRGGPARVVALNALLLFYVLPGSSLVRVLTSLAALVVAAISAARVASSLVGTPREVSPPDDGAPRSLGVRSGALVAGLAIASLAVAGGAALDPAAAGLVGTEASGNVAATGEVTRADVHVEGMRFVPGSIEVPAGNSLEITLTNTGTDVHDLVLADGSNTGRLAPGEVGTIVVGPLGADLDGWCSVAGHRQMGMVLQIVVTGSSATANHAHTSPAGPAAIPDLMGEPGEGWEPYPAALAPLGEQTEHHITLEVTELAVEVAPGVTQTRWTFGGTAPGPVIRGRIGDTFVITLVNDGTIGHSIDFHAGALAPDQPMRTIQPGETLEYRFTATRSGIWLYHCSTMPMSMHIAQGMYGAVIIEPDGLPAVDHEFVMVQGESYLGPEGGETDADALASGDHNLVHFNGYPFQYDHVPLEVGVGERIRIWVLAAGPNVASSFHVVGGQFDTVWMEGDYRLRPGGSDDAVGSGGGSQALGLLPAQGGFVELELPEAGHYPFVTHIMSDAEKGAKGTLHASD